MAYTAKIEESKSKVYNHAIATKILDLMEKLRFDESENSSRRWIWELLQNAKDVAYEDIGVSIKINFQVDNDNGFIEFKHNGRPFSIDNLTFLIEQVSTKEREPKDTNKLKTTGKFGTGFLTTHLLSEIVEVESFLKEPDEPYRKFNILLDRSCRNINDIIESVNNSLISLENIDSKQSFDQYSRTDFNTIFRYKLDQKGIEVAKKGLNDLHISLVFMLAFLPEIKSVKIVNENTQYELSQKVIEEGKNIKIYTVYEDTPNGRYESKIAVLSKEDTFIAIAIEYRNGRIYLKEFAPQIPRLFCDFPLIGTEDFSFPVIINSSAFNPNEPRNGVYLIDQSDLKIDENKTIILDAVELYFSLLEYASTNNWGNIYLLAKISPIKEKGWISKKWFKNQVIDSIREKLLVTPIVDTENRGRIPIITENDKPNVWFPYASNKDLRNKIWDLANLWIPSKLPRKCDVDVWYETIWSGCSELTLEVITRSIQKRECLNKLDEELVKSTNSIEWLNSYFKLLDMDEDFLDDVINDKYVIIPNQNGIFKKRTELKIDKQIEEELKNVLLILDVDCREYLIHQSINTGQHIKYNSKNQEEIVDEINKIIHEGTNEEIGQACDYLVTLFSIDTNFPKEREEIYQFCKLFYPDDVNTKRKIKRWSEQIWLEVDKKELKWITHAISETKNVNALTEMLEFNNEAQTLNWLNRFVSFLAKHDFANLLDLKKEPILLNQNGYFRVKDDLFLDDGEIDETLKDVSAELGYDFRDELLDLNIYLDLPKNRTKSQVNVAEEIVRLITPRFAEFPRSEETKKIFKKLYLWFNKNKEVAARTFGDLYLSKHRLYDDDEIAENMQKAEELSDLMVEFGIDDLSTLKQVLQTNKTRELIEQREQITQETLVSLGVTSIEELEEALKDQDIAGKFVHTSTPTIEMFKYVQGLISRAKTNVIEYLKTLPDYDCSEMEELATTVIGGIKKDGLMIHVVVRPSDNGEVIVYYSSEKDTLDYANAELWIDNGVDKPRHLTLGKILKITGINRIPVKGG